MVHGYGDLPPAEPGAGPESSSEERIRAWLEHLPVMLSHVDRDLRHTLIYSPHPDLDELLIPGKSDEELFPPEPAAVMVRVKKEVLSTGAQARCEWSLPHSDGPHVYDVTIEPLRDEAGLLVGPAMVVVEITDCKQAEYRMQVLVHTLEKEVGRRMTALEEEVARRKELERQLLVVADAERRRIGQELHDNLGQQLSAISIQTSILHTILEQEGSPQARRTAQLKELAGRAARCGRGLARTMISMDIEADELTEALRHLSGHMEEVYGVRCDYEEDGEIAVENSETATHLFRIAQEALHNAIKHAQPTALSIRLSASGEHGNLRVQDDGVGIPEEALTKWHGVGLRAMHYRADLIGGRLEIGKGERAWYRYYVRISKSPAVTGPPAGRAMIQPLQDEA